MELDANENSTMYAMVRQCDINLDFNFMPDADSFRATSTGAARMNLELSGNTIDELIGLFNNSGQPFRREDNGNISAGDVTTGVITNVPIPGTIEFEAAAFETFP